MLLVPAGAPVDSVIAGLLPLLAPGDLIIDGGNSHYPDTDRRARELAAAGIQFLGLGVSGGEEGARRGPSLMPGGSKEAYERVRPLLEAVAAKVDGEPCVTHLGPGSAGHYVKMVHNGIEYALMELIAETYDLMKRGLGLDKRRDPPGLPGTGAGANPAASCWRSPRASSSGRIRSPPAPWWMPCCPVARQKGTGLWTSQSAMERQVPVPTIDLAVAQRDLSALDRERAEAARVLPPPPRRPPTCAGRSWSSCARRCTPG